MDHAKLREILDSIPIEAVGISDDGTVTIKNVALAQELQGLTNQSLGEVFLADSNNGCGNNVYKCTGKLTDAATAANTGLVATVHQ